jgi:hypothetical protein
MSGENSASIHRNPAEIVSAARDSRGQAVIAGMKFSYAWGDDDDEDLDGQLATLTAPVSGPFPSRGTRRIWRWRANLAAHLRDNALSRGILDRSADRAGQRTSRATQSV